MLPIVARFSGQPFAKVFASLESRSAKILVLLALPFAPLLYGVDKIRGLIRR
jgi:hypothetical protein